MKDSAAQYDIRERAWERHPLDRFQTKILREKMWGQEFGEAAHIRNRIRIGIHAKDLVSLSEKIDEIAAGATTRVEDAHSGNDATPEELVEKVDIDIAKLLVK